MTTIHVPEQTAGEFIIDARTFEPRRKAKPTGCLYCGGDVEMQPPRRSCSKSHARAATKARKEGNPLPAEPGSCHCGADLGPGWEEKPCAFCSPRCRTRFYRYTRAFEWFRSRVQWPQPLSRLAEKLNLPEDDPNLGDIALQLAEAEKIIVYVTPKGVPGAYGKPKEPRA